MTWIDKKTMADGLFAGTWLNSGTAIAAEIAGLTGYDWALIDMEHGSGDRKYLYMQLLALQPSTTSAIVRVPCVDSVLFKDILDLGPAGLMVPDVQSAETAERIVKYARVPPVGIRGAATSTRASGYGLTYERYLEECNRSLVLMAQIESPEGVQAAESIAVIDGIDVLFVGPTDLSISLGVPQDMNDAVFCKALSDVARAAKNQGKLCGALVRRAEEVETYRSLGYTVLSFGSDRSILQKGFANNLLTLRKAGS